ncbi:MAG: hypothetical protein ABFS42_16855 [Candidatus Krumholzibacteriota bacterium]
MKTDGPHRPWLRPLLGVLIVFAILAAFMSYMFFVRWTDVTDALPTEADRIFAAAIIDAGEGPPYIEIAADGTVVVHREQEGNGTGGFDTLTLLAWTATEKKLLRLDYPGWFVRLKTSSSLNLGTMIAAVRKDWGHLDLSVSYADLARRGPALLLDHRLENGSRIMLWTSAKGD